MDAVTPVDQPSGRLDSGTSDPPRMSDAAGDPARPDGPAPDTRAEVGPDVASDAGLGNGALCGSDGACASGFCTDGVCCELRCATLCRACAQTKTNQSDGLCRPVRPGTDPDGECPNEGAMSCRRNGTCDGASACALYSSTTACGASSCSGNTSTPAPRCNGTGTCVPLPSGPCPGSLICESSATCKTACASSSDCTGGLACDSVTKQCGPPKKANGQACDPGGGGADCQSGSCVDGFCCENSCGGTCQGCSAAKTGQSDGACAPIAGGTDPDNECGAEAPSTCGRDGFCDGGGACRRHPDGTLCWSSCCTTGTNKRPCHATCAAGTCNMTSLILEDRCMAPNCCCIPSGKATCSLITACAVCQ